MAAPAFVQVVTGDAGAASTVDASITPTAGNALYVMLQQEHSAPTSGLPSSVAYDPAGDNEAFTAASTAFQFGTSTARKGRVFYLPGSLVDGSAVTIRGTYDFSPAASSITVVEVSGGDDSYDAYGESDGGNDSSATLTTVAAETLILVFGLNGSDGATGTPNGTNITDETERLDTSYQGDAREYLVTGTQASASTLVTGDVTWTSTTQQGCAVLSIAAAAAAAAGGQLVMGRGRVG